MYHDLSGFMEYGLQLTGKVLRFIFYSL